MPKKMNIVLFITLSLFALVSRGVDHQKVDSEIQTLFTQMSKELYIGKTCLECHQVKFDELQMSVHGEANLLANLPKGAICITCHEVNHRAQSAYLNLKGDIDLSKSVAKELACIKCHSSEVIGEEYGFPPHVPSEFEESMHYRKARLGDKKAPLCFDCHGSHSVQSVKDSSSSIANPGERAKVCAKCHYGSNPNFAMAFDHKPITWKDKPLEFFVITMFKILTLGTFVALSFFLLLDGMSLVRAAVFAKGPKHHKKEEGHVIRFTAVQRWQHFFMLATVLTLVVTGWPLFNPDAKTSLAIMNFFGGVRKVAIIHRTAGIIMIADFIFHIFYLLHKLKKGGSVFKFPMLPVLKDLEDIHGLILYFFGLRKERPAFEQFAFFEKFDYWAVFWGVAMMGCSGLVLMFPTLITQVLPTWAIKLSEIIHSDESLLAGVVLIIWHFYNVHVKPGIFPMNWAWLNGRMTKHQYEEEHKAHAERLKKEGKW